MRAADEAALLAEAEHAGDPDPRLVFLPYLSGERTPHNDPNARAGFFGLDPTARPLDLVQAVLEGVAFSLREAHELLQQAGLAIRSVAAVGGGARSRFWMQLVAHVTGLEVVRYAGSGTGPAFGAARLARIALTGEEVAAICNKPEILDRLVPDPALHAEYSRRFAAWRRLYRATAEGR